MISCSTPDDSAPDVASIVRGDERLATEHIGSELGVARFEKRFFMALYELLAWGDS